MKQGGWLTPGLYVPRDVWYQTGAKFMGLELKVSACETVLAALQKFKPINDTETLLKVILSMHMLSSFIISIIGIE